MLLHQPSLIHPFDDVGIERLLPYSRELSMSSAKTIADILAFAELIDPTSFIGSPFTSQPIYIAACAFLKEAEAHTSSQPTSPHPSPSQARGVLGGVESLRSEQKQKHSLLAQNANRNYQCCYKALQQLERYWAGIRYILVALDQKQSGIDPQHVQTFTAEEYESTKSRANMVPAWQRRLSMVPPPSPAQMPSLNSPLPEIPSGPGSPDVSHAIGWSLSGTTNSPNSHVTWLYGNPLGERPTHVPSSAGMVYDAARNVSKATSPAIKTYKLNQSAYHRNSKSSSQIHPTTTAAAEMLLGLHGPPLHGYEAPPAHFSHQDPQSHGPSVQTALEYEYHTRPSTHEAHADLATSSQAPRAAPLHYSGMQTEYTAFGVPALSEVTIQSQDVETSLFLSDYEPYLQYLPLAGNGL